MLEWRLKVWGGILLCEPSLRCGGAVVDTWEVTWRYSTTCKGPGDPNVKFQSNKAVSVGHVSSCEPVDREARTDSAAIQTATITAGVLS
jgi:hypothetical protein